TLPRRIGDYNKGSDPRCRMQNPHRCSPSPLKGRSLQGEVRGGNGVHDAQPAAVEVGQSTSTPSPPTLPLKGRASTPGHLVALTPVAKKLPAVRGSRTAALPPLQGEGSNAGAW